GERRHERGDEERRPRVPGRREEPPDERQRADEDDRRPPRRAGDRREERDRPEQGEQAFAQRDARLVVVDRGEVEAAGGEEHVGGAPAREEDRRVPLHRASLQRPTRLATVPSAGFSRQGDAMTTLENRPNTAVLVIDVQNGVVGGAHARDAVVANVASVVEKARAADVPVVWVQPSSDNLAEGSEEWQIVPELSPDETEPLVPKRYPDSFEETRLESVLGDLGVGRLFVVGAQTDECVRSTLHGALVRGYDATLVSDAHTTEDLSPWGAPPPELVIAHTNLYWGDHEA